MDEVLLLKAENRILQAENEALRTKVAELKKLLVPVYVFPPEWGLPRREAQVLAMLASSKGWVQKERFVVLASLDEEVDPTVFESHFSKLRKKLRLLQLPITIVARRFEGYYMDDHSKIYLQQFKQEQD